MLVDFLDPCPRCDGLGVDITKWESANERFADCDCVGGLVVSEDDIEKVAESLAKTQYPNWSNIWEEIKHDGREERWRQAARAAVTTLIQEWKAREA